MFSGLRIQSHLLAGLVLLGALEGCTIAGLGGGATPAGTGETPDGGLYVADMPQTREGLEAEVRRLRGEQDRLARTHLLLEDELRWAHEDLRLAERQFSEFEHRLTEDFGKAAAVTAAAEARIHLDRTRNTIALPDSTAKRVEDLIRTSERLIKNTNYLAALFFAERANHTLKGTERRSGLNVAGSTRMVSSTTANLRRGPGQEHAVVTTLPQGARVSCLESVGSWWRVVTTDGSGGWVHASLLR